MPKTNTIRLDFRLYNSIPVDTVIIEGLEEFQWHGAKSAEIKRILFDYYSAGKRSSKDTMAGENGMACQPIGNQAELHPISSLHSSNAQNGEDESLFETVEDARKVVQLEKVFSEW